MTPSSVTKPSIALTGGVSGTGGTVPALSLRRLSLVLERPFSVPLELVSDVSLDLAAGERLALVGESGSGKTVLARSLLGLDRQIRRSGEMRLAGELVDGTSEKALRAVRGRRIAMVFQNPLGALDPLMTIGAQLAEPLRANGVSRAQAGARASALLSELGIVDARRRLKAYPHEFSGGMQQRVCLAMALAAEPEILIADEPTTALDVRAQEQVLDALDRVATERGLSVVLISHDLSLVAGFADRVAVMYAGRVVHIDSVDAVFASPAHPYTEGLLGAIPRIDRRRPRLATIDGTIPSPGHHPAGCVFEPRCPRRLERCATEAPTFHATAGGGTSACHLLGPGAADEVIE